MRDDIFMRRALVLAAKAKGNTSPNPMVGAVVVASDGAAIAEGWHVRAGAPHAESVALERAGPRARGATLYVTLEPCNHAGRTPPCTEAILRAGVARVVVAAGDDDERVRGEGARQLREAGIDVVEGVLEEEARRLNRLYFHHRRTGRPYVTVKMAQSTDGAIGIVQGERRQLTGSAAAAYVRSLRYEHDAVMIGIGTALADNPQLTVRPFKERAIPFVRIVVDSSARLPLKSKLVRDMKRARTIVAAGSHAPPERVEALRAAGVEILTCRSTADGRIELRDLFSQLGMRGTLGILCEGGPTLAGAILDAGLADALHLLVAPVVLGSASAAPVVAGIRTPVKFRTEIARRLGEDALIVAVRESGD